MATINKIQQDVEVKRQEKNSTEAQKRNLEATKEGIVVNSLIKSPNINQLYNTMVISDDTQMPTRLYESKNIEDKSLWPLSIIGTGVMGTIALISYLVKRSADVSLTIKPEKKLDDIIRNVNINDENVQGLYQMIHCPNKKTILAGTGVIALGAMAFMAKMFMDGFKDVWVKKREADIQKNLQENLIAVETQAFSGKLQIMRTMLAEKAKEFNDYLCSPTQFPPIFRDFNPKISFGNQQQKEEEKQHPNLKYFAMGALTLGAIVGLGFFSIRNLSKGKGFLEKYMKEVEAEIPKIVSASTKETKDADKKVLKKMFLAIDASPDYIRSVLSKLQWEEQEKESFIQDVILSIQKSTTKPPDAIGGDGTPKPAFNSFISDYRTFLYNYLLDSENPQFKMLFWSVTGLTALTYGGKILGEAVKEVQVKKINAQTELSLQRRLVATELRNFKAKKDSAIEPLCDEFYTQLKRGKSKEELQTMAENILFEVKNGPPFIYS